MDPSDTLKGEKSISDGGEGTRLGGLLGAAASEKTFFGKETGRESVQRSDSRGGRRQVPQETLRSQLSGNPSQARPHGLRLPFLEAAARHLPLRELIPTYGTAQSNSTCVPTSAPPDDAVTDPEPQLRPAVAPSRQFPGPLTPRSQTGAAFSSAPGRSPTQLTGCYYSL